MDNVIKSTHQFVFYNKLIQHCIGWKKSRKKYHWDSMIEPTVECTLAAINQRRNEFRALFSNNNFSRRIFNSCCCCLCFCIEYSTDLICLCFERGCIFTIKSYCWFVNCGVFSIIILHQCNGLIDAAKRIWFEMTMIENTLTRTSTPFFLIWLVQFFYFKLITIPNYSIWFVFRRIIWVRFTRLYFIFRE